MLKKLNSTIAHRLRKGLRLSDIEHDLATLRGESSRLRDLIEADRNDRADIEALLAADARRDSRLSETNALLASIGHELGALRADTGTLAADLALDRLAREQTPPAPPPPLCARNFIGTRGPSIYVLTALAHNHHARGLPIDARLLGKHQYIFYFFDEAVDLAGFPKPALREVDILPIIAEAGRKHLAEWAFLLAEYDRGFASYPFFMTSSRFYEKNTRLVGTLDDYWDDLFALLSQYGYGYLPSYDRDFGFCDIVEYFRKGYLRSTPQGCEYIARKLGLRMPDDYRFVSDFWCNYIGFNSRQDLVRYVEFYRPIILDLFTPDYQLKQDYLSMGLVGEEAPFRAYKPLTLLLEQASHIFFHQTRTPFFGLHYDGFHEVREWATESRLIRAHDVQAERGA